MGVLNSFEKNEIATMFFLKTLSIFNNEFYYLQTLSASFYLSKVYPL